MINKIPREVPPEVKFISEWENYELPKGKCIVDKKVCGCGYTEFCLNNKDNLILCSPRKSLLENKLKQNKHCYYFQPIIISNREKKRLKLYTESDVSKFIFNEQQSRVSHYLSRVNIPKFLVTYDSLPKLLEILESLQINTNSFRIVVDEFQLIFSDARFKANVEIDFIEYLDRHCKDVIYLSSTPMLESYLEIIPSFENIDYYELIWGEEKLSKVKVLKIPTSNLEKSAVELILLYKSGKGPIKTIKGKEYRSTEAVLYVNNVSMVTSIIKNSGLTPSEVNIITSKTPENLKKIKKCGKGFGFGDIPTRGEKIKLITLCTSTAFCGVDFYSETAKSYVFSDCNLKTMAIDIAIELPQIAGRQRLNSNPFRGDITMYYTESIRNFSEEDFKEEIQNKINLTKDSISNFEFLKGGNKNIDLERERLRVWIKNKTYSMDYTSLSKESGLPVFNNLVLASDIRSWELQNRIYNNDEEIVRILETFSEIDQSDTRTSFLEKFVSLSTFEERLSLLVDHLSVHPEDEDLVPEDYLRYLKVGTKSLRKGNIDRVLKIQEDKSALFSYPAFKEEIRNTFLVGLVYSNKEIKEKLNNILLLPEYRNFRITLKASDILSLCRVSSARTYDEASGKRGNGVRINGYY